MPATRRLDGTTPPGPRRSWQLDVGAWLVLHSALRAEAPGHVIAGDFAPADFGIEGRLPEHERRAAWEILVRQGLARHVPARDETDALVPPFAAALRTLLTPEVRVDVRAWSGDIGVSAATGWIPGQNTTLARRRRLVGGDLPGDHRHEQHYEQEGVIELAVCGRGHLPHEITRMFPPSTAPGPTRPSEPVTVGVEESVALALALRQDRADLAEHIIDLGPDALSVVGAAVTGLVGGAHVVAHAPRPGTVAGPQIDVYRSLWLWTTADIVEVLAVSATEITLRRVGAQHVSRSLLEGLSALVEPTVEIAS